MSVDYNFFVGPYMRVWFPEEPETRTRRSCPKETCPSYKIYISSEYCPRCGRKIEEISYEEKFSITIHDFCERYFDDEDLFTSAESEYFDNDYSIVLPNKLSDQGGEYLDKGDTVEKDTREFDFSDFDKPDWVKLIKKLDELKIRYEKKVGIVKWFS